MADGSRFVVQAKPQAGQPQTALEVLEGGIREILIEPVHLEEEIALQRDVARVEVPVADLLLALAGERPGAL